MSRQDGQTVIALLIFMGLSIMVTVVAATITITNIQSNNAYTTGEQALGNAESGAENALLRLERDPTYTGESLTLPNGTATISVSGATTLSIVSTGTSGDDSRTVTVTATDTNNTLVVTGWSETP